MKTYEVLLKVIVRTEDEQEDVIADLMFAMGYQRGVYDVGVDFITEIHEQV